MKSGSVARDLFKGFVGLTTGDTVSSKPSSAPGRVGDIGDVLVLKPRRPGRLTLRDKACGCRIFDTFKSCDILEGCVASRGLVALKSDVPLFLLGLWS